jgi:hypothetical protein
MLLIANPIRNNKLLLYKQKEEAERSSIESFIQLYTIVKRFTYNVRI